MGQLGGFPCPFRKKEKKRKAGDKRTPRHKPRDCFRRCLPKDFGGGAKRERGVPLEHVRQGGEGEGEVGVFFLFFLRGTHPLAFCKLSFGKCPFLEPPKKKAPFSHCVVALHAFPWALLSSQRLGSCETSGGRFCCADLALCSQVMSDLPKTPQAPGVGPDPGDALGSLGLYRFSFPFAFCSPFLFLLLLLVEGVHGTCDGRRISQGNASQMYLPSAVPRCIFQLYFSGVLPRYTSQVHLTGGSWPILARPDQALVRARRLACRAWAAAWAASAAWRRRARRRPPPRRRRRKCRPGIREKTNWHQGIRETN